MLIRLCLFSTALLFIPADDLFAQTKDDKPATASIAGRVTFNNQPLAGVTVTIEAPKNLGVGITQAQHQPVTTRTDVNGNYRLQGIAAGYYLVWPHALAYVMPVEGLTGRPGRTVTLSEGEAVEGLDFELVKGCVITGRISDYLGRPVVAQRVNLRRYTTGNETMPFLSPASSLTMFETDDRGIYRLFGLPAGRYCLSAGGEGNGQTDKIYARTFYPGVNNEKAARAIEVPEGGEALNIDIRLPKPEKLYEVRGHVIDADTRMPVVDIRLSCSSPGNPLVLSERTNVQGEFILQGLATGRYTAMLQTDSRSRYYSDPVTFEIDDTDTAGLEINAYRCASISGVVVIEGASDPALLKRVAEVRLDVSPSQQQRTPFFFSSQMTGPDGTFQLAGLRPGLHRINASDVGINRSLRLARIERDGLNVSEGLELKAGEQITGLKIVMAYGVGRIRGQITFVNGSLRSDLQVIVFAFPLQSEAKVSISPVQVDAQGKFVIEGLAPGDYELRTFIVLNAGMPQPSMPAPLRQKVTVGPGDTPVTLTLDFSGK